MAVKFYGINSVYSASSITGSDTNAQFPETNLQDDRRTKVWRSNSNSSSLVFSFASPQSIDSFCVVGNSLTGLGVTSITIQLNSTNSWSSPAVSVSVPLDTTFGFGFYDWSTTQVYQYAKVICTSTLGYCELSNIYLGPISVPGALDFTYPLSFTQNRLAVTNINRYGQKFIDDIITQRTITGSIQHLYPSELDQLLAFFDVIKTTKPCFIRFNATNIFTNVNRLNGMYYLKAMPVMSFQVGNFWDLTLTLDEAT